jgi:hypothetical protein
MSIVMMKKIIVLLLCFFVCHVSLATSVKEVSIDDLAINAEFIFEGRCIDTTTQQVPNSRFIKTIATFEVIDVIKGDYQDSTIQLEYLGGSFKGKELKIGDMVLPQFNDHGIYFVEKLNEQQIHPLLGWDQGRITIHNDEQGIERVGTSNHKPITSIEPKQDRSSVKSQAAISKGVARGVQSVESINWETALKKQDFKNKIKDIINKQ